MRSQRVAFRSKSRQMTVFPVSWKRHLPKDEVAVEAILASRSYYHLSSDKFLSTLRDMDPSSDEGMKIGNALRRMLANLEGPFQLPHTLSQADEKLLQAFDALEKTMSGAQEASALIAALWEHNVEQKGIFRLRAFPADIRLLEHAPDDLQVIFACSGGALINGRKIDVFSEKNSNTLRGEIHTDPSYFDCEEPAIDVQQMLTGTVPIPLGISHEAFGKLYPTGDSTRSEDGIIEGIKFIVYPRNLDPARSKEN